MNLNIMNAFFYLVLIVLVLATSAKAGADKPLEKNAGVFMSQMAKGFALSELNEENSPQIPLLSKSEVISILLETRQPSVDVNKALLRLNPFYPTSSKETLPEEFHQCFKNKLTPEHYTSFRQLKINNAFNDSEDAKKLIFQVSLLNYKGAFNYLDSLYINIPSQITNDLESLFNPSAEMIERCNKEHGNCKFPKAEEFLDFYNAKSFIRDGAQKKFDDPQRMLAANNQIAFDVYTMGLEPSFNKLNKVLILHGRHLVKDMYSFNNYIYEQCSKELTRN